MVAIYESKQNSSGRKIKFKAIKYIKNNKNHQKLEASASSITFLHVLVNSLMCGYMLKGFH